MKPDQLYQNLLELAEKLGINVTEENLKISGLKVKSGLCTLKGEKKFIMDKKKSAKDKAVILAECLCEFQFDDIYIVPAVREFLDKQKVKKERDVIKAH